MSVVESKDYKCDHCGFSCNNLEGDGDLGWYHPDSESYFRAGLGDIMGIQADLCPNCVSELKSWLRAGPQHEEYRRQLLAQESVRDTKLRERAALSRHPASNRRTVSIPGLIPGTTEEVPLHE